jgi:hypothetical protein
MTIEITGAGEKGQSRALDQHESVHASLLAELRNYKPIKPYEPSAEYKNGLASQNLIGIEKWVDESKHCGAIDQDQLAAKLAGFAGKTDQMWHKMESNPKTFVSASQDQWLTYPRFNKMFDLLDDQHRDKLLETLPWSLRAATSGQSIRFLPG